MSRRSGGVILVVAMTVAMACGPKRVPAPVAAPVARAVVVLLADPEDGHVGRVEVSNAEGRVDLAATGASTSVAAGAAPSSVVTMPEADIQSLFGAALASRPKAARRFLLYFETGGSTLTAESKAQVADLLTEARAATAPDVAVIGHTDTIGAAETNAKIALERAVAVRDLLVGAGLDPALIEVVSHGETDLLVPTPDGTAEARNRRVEVTIR